MRITYKKLWKLLIDKNMNKGDLQKMAGLSASSVAKLSKGANVQTDLLVRICEALNCDTADVMEIDRDEREGK
jgi:DNA-binding Xre family transcriptional regulator